MNILFITAPGEDYAGDAMLHGLRQLHGSTVVDFPKCEPLYRTCSETIKAQVRGRGFTLYTGLLDDLDIDRFKIAEKIASGFFELIIFANIWRTFGYFVQWRPWLRPENCVLLDGEDSAQVYGHAGYWWRRPYYWFLPRGDRRFLYFKREWTTESRFGALHRLLPEKLKSRLPNYAGLRRFSFSIPEEKIVRKLTPKTARFARHIVDGEVAKEVPGSATQYAFANEAEYYANLQAAQFGVTTKRAGWDCLRHYEIAANGCVPCFRDIEDKPETCAPHDLVPGVNCISYRNYKNLSAQIDALPEEKYLSLQKAALEWARSKSTIVVAAKLVEEWRRENSLVAKNEELFRSPAHATKGNEKVIHG